MASGPSSAIDVQAEIQKIQDAWEVHEDDDKAVQELVALGKRAGASALELILEGARQIAPEVRKKVKKLLSS